MNISGCVLRSFAILVCLRAFLLSVLLCKSNSSKAKFNSCGRVLRIRIETKWVGLIHSASFMFIVVFWTFFQSCF